MAEKLSDKHVLGMVLFVMSETVFFMLLILAFVFYRASPANAGGPTAFNSLDVPITGIYTACLTASSVTFWLAGRHHRRGHTWRWHAWLLLTMLLGGAFIYGEARDFADMSSRGIVPASDLFGSTFYALVGFHGFHVSMGLIILSIVLVLSLGTPHFRGGRHAIALDAISVYWIFVDAMWWIIFPTVYLLSLAPPNLPHL
jgi:heme/copper-type cytochrome/quinol oxidase subunit 3